MAGEDKKDFNAMLHDGKDMPKIQIITDEASIKKYGGNRMYFAPPMDYDRVMRRVPLGKVITVGEIREYFAAQSGADFTEPITAARTKRPTGARSARAASLTPNTPAVWKSRKKYLKRRVTP